jgi:hypothetical protein
MQYNSQRKSIEDSRDKINAGIQKKIDAINDAQTKLGDKAALAAEGLTKLADKIATQRQKIEDFNRAMTTLVLNALAAGKSVADYIKYGTNLDPKAGQNDAGGLVTAGVAVGGVKGNVKGIDVGAKALELMTGPLDAIKSSLKTKGIEMNGGNLNIVVGGKSKKLDVTSFEDGKKSNAQVSTQRVKGKDEMSVSGLQLRAEKIPTKIGTEFFIKDQRYRIIGAPKDNGYVPVEKAGYGTMKLNPKIPTIVGDRGPEMAFGGMIIPNMAKVPFASPRYDVNQAAKMFEPMKQNNQAGVINLTQNIYPSEGMNTDAFVRQVVSMTKQAIGQDSKLNAKMVGNPMNVSIKK